MQWRGIASSSHRLHGNNPDAEGQTGADDDAADSHRNAPLPDPACLYGLVGDVARAGSDNTEANPYAIAANFIAYLSCAVGRGPYLPVSNTWHHARLFILHIGRSGRGRKGDAVSLITRLDLALRELSERASPQIHRGGLSSREGLAALFHDGYRRGKEDVPPIEDKRLWVVESEFANVLHQGRRDGNTLSAALRDCWDGVPLKPATQSNRLYASHPHLSLVGGHATRNHNGGFSRSCHEEPHRCRHRTIVEHHAPAHPCPAFVAPPGAAGFINENLQPG